MHRYIGIAQLHSWDINDTVFECETHTQLSTSVTHTHTPTPTLQAATVAMVRLGWWRTGQAVVWLW